MTASTERKSAAELGLKIEGLNHFTLPVRRHDVARTFYVEVLGGVVTHEPDWERVRLGFARSAPLSVHLFQGPGKLDLFYQPFGFKPTDEEHPRWSFEASAAELEALIDRLGEYGVPFFGPVLQVADATASPGDLVDVEVVFNDPDGNALAVTASDYPFRAGMERRDEPRWDLYYRWDEWAEKHAEKKS
jgi:hypothetical protein